jgi:ABC-type Zn uptake system ZnuABC Zn-binding protein ZnuA
MDGRVMRMLRPRAILGLTASRRVVAIALLAALGLGACGGNPAGEEPIDPDALRVVTTTTVLADLVGQVGGNRVAVRSIVPKGGEVHTFDPTPSDVAAIAEADVVIANGLGLDAWLDELIANADADVTVLALGEDLPGVEYMAGDGHEGEAVNPHLWLDVAHARRYVERIAAELARADAGHANEYRSEAGAFDARLAALDAEIRAALEAIPATDRRVVSLHDAFPYYAAAYGLEIVGAIVDAPGQDPSAGELASLVDAIRAARVHAVLAEAQFSPELAQAVADEAGVVVVRDLYTDSLGDAPEDTYEAMMRWNTDRIVEALTS